MIKKHGFLSFRIHFSIDFLIHHGNLFWFPSGKPICLSGLCNAYRAIAITIVINSTEIISACSTITSSWWSSLLHEMQLLMDVLADRHVALTRGDHLNSVQRIRQIFAGSNPEHRHRKHDSLKRFSHLSQALSSKHLSGTQSF